MLDPRVGPASWSWSVIPPSLPGSFQNRPTTPFKKFQMVPIFFFPETKAIWVSWGLCRDVKGTVHREKNLHLFPDVAYTGEIKEAGGGRRQDR